LDYLLRYEEPMTDEARRRVPDELAKGRPRDDLRRRALERAIAQLAENLDRIGEAERAIADYCRERHREGAGPSEVIIEIKRIAQPILRDDYHRRLEQIVSSCIRHYYGDVEIDLAR
jgi:hypothetical protein